MSGLMSLTGTAQSGPLRAGAPVVDYATGYMAAFAITSALFRRERSGEGAHVDLAMFDAALMLMAAPISGLTAGGVPPSLQGNRFPSAGLGAYPTAKGMLMIGAGNYRQQLRLWSALGHPEMVKANHDESCDNFGDEEALLRRIFLTRTAADWEVFLRDHRVPAARVRTLPEALADPQLAARGVMQAAGPIPGKPDQHVVPVAPFLLSGGDPVVDRPAPGIGEHSTEVLREAGFGPAEIAALRASGAMV
jgi:crotonobetainyl-CoA:carnitine CoA-transferase CaiB-like acyl-CoA transferase